MSHLSKQTEKYHIFYKIATFDMNLYFKNPADSDKLGKIVATDVLRKPKFETDTLENFLITLGLCNNDMSEQVYIPCSSATHNVLKVNDNHQNYDTIIGINNQSIEDDSDDYSFSEIFIKKPNTEGYNNTQSLTSALIGYYIDSFGNKTIVLHDDVFYFREKLRPKERFENALVLYRWQNGKYVPDSLLTIDGELIPKENYAQAYEKYMGDSDY